MKEYIKLAWRNIWRNKRRTLITAASIFFAILLALAMRSFQLGSYDHWINNAVESFTGYVQIQHEDFWDDQTINNSFEYSDSLISIVENTDNVKYAIPRLQSFALASSGEHTKGVMVLGIDPEVENKLTGAKNKLVKYRITQEAINKIEKQENLPPDILKKLKKLRNNSYSNSGKIQVDLQLNGGESTKEYIEIITRHTTFDGKYLTSDDKGALVADRLAKFLDISINDTIILIGQGFHGVSAAGKYPVRGIVKFPAPDLDKSLVFLSLPTAQYLFGAQDRVTSLALNLYNHNDGPLKNTVQTLRNKINHDQYAVKDWKTMNKELVQQVESDSKSGLIMLGILYLIVAFGVFGTVLMMTAERRREFGVMIAVGMQKLKLAGIVAIEMFIIGLLGMISGIIASIPVVLIGHYNPVRLTGDMAKMMEDFGIEPVMPFALFGDYYINQSLVVIVIVFVAIIYPIYTITRINVIKAMRG